jgi:hypothetical protein
VRRFFEHGPLDVQADDVLCPFPDGVALPIPKLAGHRPVFDVAIAGEDLDGLARQFQAATGRAELGQRREHARQAVGAIPGGIDLAGLEDQRRRRLRLHRHLHQRLSHRRPWSMRRPNASRCGVDGRIQERAARDAQAHDGTPRRDSVTMSIMRFTPRPSVASLRSDRSPAMR